MHEEERDRRRWKKPALALIALALVLLVLTLIWWGNLADSDVEKGPVNTLEGLTDSADDGPSTRRN